MNPKEKALDLQNRMKDCLYSDGLVDAKQCALICIEEILEITSLIEPYLGYDFYLEVKEELLKL